MNTYHIHIGGQVQGVGFRPFVYRLALQLNLKGFVLNADDGVHIEINGEEPVIKNFLNQILEHHPLQAKIERHTLSLIKQQSFNEFKIIGSAQSGNNNLRITPDFSICSDCSAEMSDKDNRRYGYAFTTCTQCGPRYSVQTDSPYDRHTTSMVKFIMCEACLKEYNSPSDIRFYAQTNSCAACGIQLSVYVAGKQIKSDTPIQFITGSLRQGQIVAVKGVGGYLLMADANNAAAIRLLRERKHRPSKPFALMYPSREILECDANISNTEWGLMSRASSPIVLVETKKNSQIQMGLIAPGLNKIGVMLPYAPLFKLISDDFGKPLVATSGNVSGAPIIYKDEDALSSLNAFADVIVNHNREIVIPQDDSVVQVVNEKSFLLRRSRGFAPSYFGPTPNVVFDGVIAMGADIKSSIGISNHGQWYVSQFLGNQESYESQIAYDKVFQHLIHLTGTKPACILADQHPGYYTTQKGNDLAKEAGLPIVSIQHHEAHFAAVLQENNLIDANEPILGVIWDGTGFGSDGNSWGGEFFEYDQYTISRVSHLGYVPVLLGDKMAREPRLSAMAFSGQREVHNFVRDKFSPKEFELYSKMLNKPELFTSSMGRLFDAVASLLGLCDVSTYEGEAALYLQNLAATAKTEINEGYPIQRDDDSILTAPIMDGIIKDMVRGDAKNQIALKFHLTLVSMIQTVACKKNYKKIAFSGGVFQNGLLLELIVQGLSDFKLYFHQELSPNDENISFGQLAHFHLHQRKLKQTV